MWAEQKIFLYWTCKRSQFCNLQHYLICTVCTSEVTCISPFILLIFSSISRWLVMPYRMDVDNSHLFSPREAVTVYRPCRQTRRRCPCVVSTAVNSAVIKAPRQHAMGARREGGLRADSGSGSFASDLCFPLRIKEANKHSDHREGWERMRCGEQ